LSRTLLPSKVQPHDLACFHKASQYSPPQCWPILPAVQSTSGLNSLIEGSGCTPWQCVASYAGGLQMITGSIYTWGMSPPRRSGRSIMMLMRPPKWPKSLCAPGAECHLTSPKLPKKPATGRSGTRSSLTPQSRARAFWS